MSIPQRTGLAQLPRLDEAAQHRAALPLADMRDVVGGIGEAVLVMFDELVLRSRRAVRYPNRERELVVAITALLHFLGFSATPTEGAAKSEHAHAVGMGDDPTPNGWGFTT